jgi:hypothetical protein
MSDFLYAATRQPGGRLAEVLAGQTGGEASACVEFHGTWGSLAVMPGLYPRYYPFEDEADVLVVLGGPRLEFAGAGAEPGLSGGASALLGRMRGAKPMDWFGELAGAFLVLRIRKADAQVEVVTDPLAQIPAFRVEEGGFWIGSHVDALAVASGTTQVDPVSAADFLANGFVVHPYTLFEGVTCLEPGTRTSFTPYGAPRAEAYWQPKGGHRFHRVDDAAMALREAFGRAVRRPMEDTEHIAILLSGGEDARAVLGAIDRPVDAFTFLDAFNREAALSGKVARAYGARLQIGLRSETHYLDLLQPISALAGAQFDFLHAHTYRFHERYGLSGYDVVFGGYGADTYLKGQFMPVRRRAIRSLDVLPAMPAFLDAPSQVEATCDYLRPQVAEALGQRWRWHYERVADLRGDSASEWTRLWPFSMRAASAWFHTNRRLFRAVEPYLDRQIIEISASVPQEWKLNRTLFHAAFRPFLSPSWHIGHSKAQFPYFGRRANVVLGAWILAVRKLKAAVGAKGRDEGPWKRRSEIGAHPKVLDMAGEVADRWYELSASLLCDEYRDVGGRALPPLARLHLLQVASCLPSPQPVRG